MDSPSKSCSLDPWPTFLVLDYLDILITPITSIINASLEQGKCPNFFKQAHVTLILKKSSLDKEIFKNYRPFSNMNFISKILERVVAVQLQTHLDEAGLMTAFQSAYRKYHSTESALLNIHNDILSAAFDTNNHTILLGRFNVYYGISELALGWFKSYLSGRTHLVKVAHFHTLLRSSMGSPRAPSLVQFFFPSTLTQLAQSVTLTVVLSTISTLMTLSYT